MEITVENERQRNNSATAAHVTGERASLGQRFYVDDWLADVSTNRFRQGGREIRVEPRVMALLQVLAAQPGELVRREEIERRLWGRIVVGYDALNSTVNKLRKALGDDSRRPRFIETVSKRGYRFVAVVRPVDGVAPGNVFLRLRKSRRGLAIGAALSVVFVFAAFAMLSHQSDPAPTRDDAGLPSVAVMPFRDLGPSGSHSNFAAGMTTDVTTALAKRSGLFVVSPASTDEYRGRLVNVTDVAEVLGIRYLLEGSVQRTQTRLRVNVQLVDARRGNHVWSERYDRKITDVFDVQDDISERIASALLVTVSEEEKQRTARRYTASIDAYDEFLHGQAWLARFTREDNQRARDYFQHAIDLDPNFARAHGALALTYVEDFRSGWSTDPTSTLVRAHEASNRAVELDDHLPQVHWVRAFVQLYRGEVAAAFESAQRAVRAGPNDPDSHVVLALSSLHAGNPELALKMIRRAMRLNPRYPSRYAATLGKAYYFLGRYEDAIPALRDAIERNANLLPPHVYLTIALDKIGNYDDAAWAAAQLRSLAPGFRAAKLNELVPMADPAIQKDMADHLRHHGF